MCGISGFSGFGDKINPRLIIEKMCSVLNHRGPDNKNCYVNSNKEIALGHNRLSIIDLSIKANQPMFSSDKKKIIIFNGEIYNFLELKEELKKYAKENNKVFNPKTSTDTEILIEGIQLFGIENFVKKLEGMFAFALYDIEKNKIYLTRDRFGEKPLYFGQQEQLFFFSSELKALCHNPLIKREVDHDSLLSFLKFSQVPAPKSIYKNIKKLLPGNILEYCLDEKKYKIKTYWTSIKKKSLNNIEDYNENKIINEFDYLLYQTMQKSIISDRPVAHFLSGGIDSSLLTSIASSFTENKISTFTAGFKDKNNLFDESKYANRIAKYLNTNHHEFFFSENDLFDVIHQMPEIFCEPFGDSSQIPTLLISREMRKNFTVAIAGDGGDEIFGGYYRYLQGYNLWKQFNKNNFLRGFGKIFSILLSKMPLSDIEKTIKRLNINFLPNDIDLKVSKFKKILEQTKLKDYYSFLVSSDMYEEIFPNNEILNSILNKIEDLEISDQDKLILMDLNFYMPNDILNKVDRASMSTSLEVRNPFLNHKILEKIENTPSNLKFKNNSSKYILKKILEKYLPKKYFNRPKQGFEIPVKDWLLGNKKEFFKQIIFDRSTNLFEHVSYEKIQSCWKLFEAKRNDYSKLFWNLLMYQYWSKKYL